MKRIILYVGVFCLALSCTVDDSFKIEETDFYGDWNLLSAEANRDIDYNFDGETATDIMDDFDCFTIQLELNPDNSFKEVIIDRSVIENEVECSINANSGTWKYLEESNQIEFNYLDENDELINTVRSEVSLDRNSRFEFLREFTDKDGSFKASLLFLYLNS